MNATDSLPTLANSYGSNSGCGLGKPAGTPASGHASTVTADAVPRHEPPSAHLWAELGRACRHPLQLPGELASRVRNDDILTTAAALAYYFFFSIFPLLLFVLALTTLLPVQGLEAWLLDNARQSLPGEAFALVDRTVRGLLATPRGGLLSLGGGLALWTASAAFAAVMNGPTAPIACATHGPGGSRACTRSGSRSRSRCSWSLPSC